MTKKVFFVGWLFAASFVHAQQPTQVPPNQAPLLENPYYELPLGTIKPAGWLKKMLELQRDGLTGNLDIAYEEVCGPNNAWLGGTGDAWERGPYWIDGLMPLAYQLNDEKLKTKAQQWVEWSIKNQRQDGYFGPLPPSQPLPVVKGIQNKDHEDWWPKMVMLKVLQQYYGATGDQRVIKLMLGYFRYMLTNLPEKPLNHWSYWGQQRGGDNLAIVFWLYNITKEPFLLTLGDLIYKQSTPWKSIFTDGTLASQNPYPNLHCVNVAQGAKTPGIWFQRSGDTADLNSIKTGLETLRKVHGFANGMYGGDEHLHGNDPTQGSELCSAVEMMFSMESILPISGDVGFADYLEKITFNVLPTQHDDDFKLRQYFQQANQIKATYHRRNFFNENEGRIVFGLLTGYPCCTANMHQGYPKYVQNLWYGTRDGGIAALVYGASELTTMLPSKKQISIKEETNYPFENDIRFKFSLDGSTRFPFHLRVPGWCKNASVTINGEVYRQSLDSGIVKIDRSWKNGDEVVLHLPMEIRTSEWIERSGAVERGPLLYALRVEEKWTKKTNKDFPQAFLEVEPVSPWNYGITAKAFRKKEFNVNVKSTVSNMPWNLANAPISLTVKGKKLATMKEFNHSAGKLPRSVAFSDGAKEETITLIPYGCTTVRISQFPLTD